MPAVKSPPPEARHVIYDSNIVGFTSSLNYHILTQPPEARRVIYLQFRYCLIHIFTDKTQFQALQFYYITLNVCLLVQEVFHNLDIVGFFTDKTRFYPITLTVYLLVQEDYFTAFIFNVICIVIPLTGKRRLSLENSFLFLHWFSPLSIALSAFGKTLIALQCLPSSLQLTPTQP